MERDPIMAAPHGSRSAELSRKRSLVRPERQRIDENHPNYHYRKHAKKMPVHPSTTGNDPIRESREEFESETVSSESTDLKPPHLAEATPTRTLLWTTMCSRNEG
jgi:chitin synthase